MSNARKLWGMPALLALVTAFGLGAGLLGDGAWDWVAALALAAPLGVAGRHIMKSARSPH